MNQPTATQSLNDLAHRFRGALGALEIDVQLETNDSNALLLAVHPQLNATIAIELVSSKSGPLATLLLMLADWSELADSPDDVERLLGLNNYLMSCAVSLVRIDDQRVLALARTLPAEQLDPADIAPLIEQMAWEYSVHNERATNATDATSAAARA